MKDLARRREGEGIPPESEDPEFFPTILPPDEVLRFAVDPVGGGAREGRFGDLEVLVGVVPGERFYRSLHRCLLLKATKTVSFVFDGCTDRELHPPELLTGVLIAPGVHGCRAPVDIAAGRGGEVR